MNDVLDPLARLKNWAELLSSMKVLEETHTFKLSGYIEDGLRFLAEVTPCEGTVTITISSSCWFATRPL